MIGCFSKGESDLSDNLFLEKLFESLQKPILNKMKKEVLFILIVLLSGALLALFIYPSDMEKARRIKSEAVDFIPAEYL